MTGRWVAASLDAYGTPMDLDTEPRFARPEDAQARADERAFALARQGHEAVRRSTGAWTITHPLLARSPIDRIVVFEASSPQTVFPPPEVAEPRCITYRPGHRVHYIQARKSREDHGDGMACEVAELIEPDVVMIGFGKSRRRWHNHDLPRLREAIETVGGQARIYEHKNMLRLRRRCFCIATPEDWQPGCDVGPTHGFLFRPQV